MNLKSFERTLNTLKIKKTNDDRDNDKLEYKKDRHKIRNR